MFRKTKAQEIGTFCNLPLAKNEVAVFYLGVSGFLVKTSNATVVFDPAGMLKGDEVSAIKGVSLIVFTHDHLDHFSKRKTEALFAATAAPILAEAKVAKKLMGKIPADKLVSAESTKTYTFGDLTTTAISGIHRGPIMLYQIKMDEITVFHGGDSGYVNLTNYPSQVALVPVGRMSPTASPENAYKMTVDLKPNVAIAMHGSEKQKHQFAQKVKEAIPNTEVLIIESYTTKTIVL